ncbi:MAG TPA: ketopantoate reductase family protein [Gemmatimonas sp.]|nr:ketopantoate reductase family protein [Gemmatimonas sp.]
MMRVLIVGAGATGGYFGGRLLQAGCDVTFLVRARRMKQLGETGLRITSPFGDVTIDQPPIVLASNIASPFDPVLVSCKAYDLTEVMQSFAAAVGSSTAILPVLNGMSHIDALAARFGADRILGGLCMISSTLDEIGTVVHLNRVHGITFGELDGRNSDRVEAIAALLSRGAFDSDATPTILHAMWEKWTFIAGLAGITSLMRGSIGDIMAAGGERLAIGLYEECSAIANGAGYGPREVAAARSRQFLSTRGSPLVASMLKDVERGSRTEADHILGDLLRRRRAGEDSMGIAPGTTSLLEVAHAALMTYEARRAGQER